MLLNNGWWMQDMYKMNVCANRSTNTTIQTFRHMYEPNSHNQTRIVSNRDRDSTEIRSQALALRGKGPSARDEISTLHQARTNKVFITYGRVSLNHRVSDLVISARSWATRRQLACACAAGFTASARGAVGLQSMEVGSIPDQGS